MIKNVIFDIGSVLMGFNRMEDKTCPAILEMLQQEQEGED